MVNLAQRFTVKAQIICEVTSATENTFSYCSAAEYLETLKNKFPNSRGLSYLLMDACYDEDDDDEKDSFNGAMSKMWNLVDKAGGLPTRKVQQVETESKKLKNDIEKKDKMLKAIDEKRYLLLLLTCITSQNGILKQRN